MPLTEDLPKPVSQVLEAFVENAISAFGNDLNSVVLYGSAAEGRLRATSDVNLILVLKSFEAAQINQIRENLRIAYAAIRLTVMFLLEDEIEAAAEAFAVKFSDILKRNRVLYGKNPFEGLNMSREATKLRLKQVLLNASLKLRERYLRIGAREEKLIYLLADFTAPLRSSAAVILDLEGVPYTSPKDALEKLVQKLTAQNWQKTLSMMSQAREQAYFQAGTAESALIDLMALIREMDRYSNSLD